MDNLEGKLRQRKKKYIYIFFSFFQGIFGAKKTGVRVKIPKLIYVRANIMVTLLDVLSLPSCGFTSIHKIMEHELKKGLQQITGNPVPNIHNQDAIRELIVRKNKRKRDKWRFISLEKKWLETQRLLVWSLFYIYFIKYASTIPGR